MKTKRELKIYNKKYRKDNIEKIKKVKKDYYDKHRLEILRKMSAYHKYRKINGLLPSCIVSTRKWQNKNPEKRKAQHIVFCALRKGILIRKNCKICGDKQTDAHHPNYSKPLKVMWLCRKHHVNEHRRLRNLVVLSAK